MTCWWCTWGWPKVIADIYLDALNKLDGDYTPLKFGPAHIVWEDENFNSAKWCIENFDKNSDNLNEYEKQVVLESLINLENVPNEFKTEPYSGDEPEKFPPPKHWECVKV